MNGPKRPWRSSITLAGVGAVKLGLDRRRLEVLHLDLGRRHRLLERVVEVAQQADPVDLPFLHLVQLGLHVRRELDVHDARESA